MRRRHLKMYDEGVRLEPVNVYISLLHAFVHNQQITWLSFRVMFGLDMGGENIVI